MEDKKLEEIKHLVSELDKKVSKDNAFAYLDCIDHDVTEGIFKSNRKGYLRLGIEFLKAAFAPYLDQKGKEKTIKFDLDYIIRRDSPVNFVEFERLEKDQMPEEPKESSFRFRDSMLCIGCATVILIFGFIFALGIKEFISWLK